jgi:intracellular multiplication protein IcmL
MDDEKNIPDNDPVVLVHLRNEFYRKKYRFTMGMYLLSLVVIAVLISLLVYIMRHPVAPRYFVADDLGRLIREIPLTQPNMSTDDVMAWTVEAIENTYSYDYVNYRGQLQNAQKYFTEFGWRNYLNGLTASNNLLALTQRQMVFVGKVIGKPTLIIESLLGGAYAYKFELQLLVTYLLPPDYSEAKAFRNPYKVSVIVQRQDLLKSYRGLAIVQLVVQSPPRAESSMSALPTS